MVGRNTGPRLPLSERERRSDSPSAHIGHPPKFTGMGTELPSTGIYSFYGEQG